MCKNHDCCYVEMPKEDNKILKYSHGNYENSSLLFMKSMRTPFIIYDNLEPLLKKMSTCQNNPENYQQTK